MKCDCCCSDDMVKATVKGTNKVIAICKECSMIYETDSNENPIYDYDKTDIDRYDRVQALFNGWDGVENVIPYAK